MDFEIRVMKWAQERFGEASNAVARLSAEIGVTQDTIRQWIGTGTPPDMETVRRLAEALALPVELLEKDFWDTRVGRRIQDDPFERFRVSLVKSRPDPQSWDDCEVALKQGVGWLASSGIQIVRVPVLHSVSTPLFSLDFDFPPQDFLPLLLVAAAGESHFSLRITGAWLESIAHDGDHILVCTVHAVSLNTLVLIQNNDSGHHSFGYLHSHDEGVVFVPASRSQNEVCENFQLTGRVVGIFRKPLHYAAE